MTTRADSPLRSSATWTLWILVGAIVVFGVLIPASAEASRFSSGYFRGCDWPSQPVLATLVLGAVLIVLALANIVFRPGIRWRQFLFALAAHAAAIVTANAAVQGTFHSVVRESISKAQTVVDAIHEFERKSGRAPETLSELVPDYLLGDPSTLYSGGTDLWYEPKALGATVPPGAWTIRPNFMDSIGIEYVPASSTRLLLPTERRLGDWIVEAREPWGSFGFRELITHIVERAFSASTEFGSGTQMCARCGARREMRTEDGVTTSLRERESPERAWAEPRIGPCKDHPWQPTGGWSSRIGSRVSSTGSFIADQHVLWRALSALDPEQAEEMARRYANLPADRLLELWSLAHELESSPEQNIALAVAKRAAWSDLAEYWSR